MSDQPKQLRCAVYTRKSTEEGLNQDFNSLHAQREACEAYIRSQKHEGWKLVPTAFDDGGISGGTMERPALKRLLAEIEAGTINIVVVYKVDRLTRSLRDFSKMVDVFDRHQVSFVAVTQQFNTTTSMGRLTLNVLLSFAQFEREVAGERIRDKIAASKKKGIWMGGGKPRGYKIVDRKLVIVPKEAATVRTIYRRYLESDGGIRALALALRREGITSVNARGEADTISRGALYLLLRNPTYAGLVRHKEAIYPGLHKAIVDRKTWGAAQKKLNLGAAFAGKAPRKTEASPLMGKLFDEHGKRLTPVHTKKRSLRYRYYASLSDDIDERRFNGAPDGWRLPALELEKRVVEVVASMLRDRGAIVRATTAAKLTTDETTSLLRKAELAGAKVSLEWVHQVKLKPTEIRVKLALPHRPPVYLESKTPMDLRRRGIEQRIVIRPSGEHVATPDHHLVKAQSLGLRFWNHLNSPDAGTATEFAKQAGVDTATVCRALRLAFLAPDLVEKFATGKHPIDWTAERALRWVDLPLSWAAQRSRITSS